MKFTFHSSRYQLTTPDMEPCEYLQVIVDAIDLDVQIHIRAHHSIPNEICLSFCLTLFLFAYDKQSWWIHVIYLFDCVRAALLTQPGVEWIGTNPIHEKAPTTFYITHSISTSPWCFEIHIDTLFAVTCIATLIYINGNGTRMRWRNQYGI